VHHQRDRTNSLPGQFPSRCAFAANAARIGELLRRARSLPVSLRGLASSAQPIDLTPNPTIHLRPLSSAETWLARPSRLMLPDHFAQDRSLTDLGRQRDRKGNVGTHYRNTTRARCGNVQLGRSSRLRDRSLRIRASCRYLLVRSVENAQHPYWAVLQVGVRRYHRS
jgi:hypothetical protein